MNEAKLEFCGVCGKPAPVGHQICDECWPDRAIAGGRAAICATCGRPRLVEKLSRLPIGGWVCITHSQT